LKSLTKYITSKTLQPAVKKYLSKTRNYRYKNISLTIPPDVFHPGFFFSTKILLRYILSLQLNEKKFLELGAGSGLISFVAAQNNAVVTATDINTVAIEYLKINSDKNHLPVQIILSDLFDEIPEEQFDIIAINPPYYKKDPQTQADLAWYCGENGEYFKKLFSNLAAYIKPSTEVFMIICDGCDIKMIHDYAAQNNFLLNCVHTESNLIELNYIYKIENLLFKQL